MSRLYPTWYIFSDRYAKGAANALKDIVPVLLFSLLLCQCAPRVDSKQSLTEDLPPSIASYTFSSFRPGLMLRNYLEEMIVAQPENVIYHRDLGTWYQSRMTLLTGAEKEAVIRRSVDHLERAYQAMPEDPQTLIYYGLALASEATLKDKPAFVRLQTALRGFRLMDEAVDKDPQNFSIRLLRAKANSLAPIIVARGASLSQDYAWIRGQLEHNEDLPIHLRTLAVIFIGDYFFEQKKDKERARTHWLEASEMASSFSEEARWRLEGTMPGFEVFASDN